MQKLQARAADSRKNAAQVDANGHAAVAALVALEAEPGYRALVATQAVLEIQKMKTQYSKTF